jgi:hypothetical protein
VAFAGDEKVGDLAGPGHLVIQGASAVRAELIEFHLRHDAGVQIAGQPKSPLAGYLEALQRQTKRGYQAVGFPDTKVEVRVQEEGTTVVIAIEEGRRYLKGKVQVTGVPPDLERYIVDRLTTAAESSILGRRPEQSKGKEDWVTSDFGDCCRDWTKAWWAAGEQAGFDDLTMELSRDRVGCILRERGYDRALFDVSCEVSGDLANLLIRVDDLGPEMIIRNVWVAGNKLNSEQEIIEYADVRPGVLLDVEEYTRIGRRLWQSARFVTQDLQVIPAADGINLMIVVKEFPQAPRLSEPLSREEATLLKMRDWLVSGEGRHEDLVTELKLHSGDGTFLSVAASFTEGFAAVISDPCESATNDGWALAVLVDDRRVSAYSRSAQTRIDPDMDGMRIRPTLTFAFRTTTSEVFHAAYSLGFNTIFVPRNEEETRFSSAVRFEPVSFLSLAHVDDLNATWEGDVLTLQTPHKKVVIDGQSGRLVEFTSSGESLSQDIRITLRRGAYEEFRARFEQEIVHCRQAFQPQEPVTSIVDFLLSSQAPDAVVAGIIPAKNLLRPEYRDELRKLVARGILKPIDQLANEMWMYDPAFRIPPDPKYSSLITSQRLAGAADALWLYDTWPWYVWRGMWLLNGGARDEVIDMYTDFKASDIGGPLAWWVISRLAGGHGSKLAVDAAYRGLKSVDIDVILADCDAMLDHNTLVGRSVHTLVTTMAEMSDEELLDVGQLLTDMGFADSPQVVLEFVAQYRQNAGLPDPMRETLRQYWEKGLTSMMVEDLRSRKDLGPLPTAANADEADSNAPGVTLSLPPILEGGSSIGSTPSGATWESNRMSKMQEDAAGKK